MIEDKLNLTFYKGEDSYSDGPVEDELLDAVQDMSKVPEILQKGDSWPFLYHLSPIRENLLDWYPFEKEGSLLEIGAGCGALTGLFCRNVKRVVAIDLSKKRSMINATRNQKYDNLEIVVGNFEDISLEEKFDYVTLIGVFEYSVYYINDSSPFKSMLERAKQYLKPGGKLILAIENKYGLKYWNGAREDHTGDLFDGLNSYMTVDRVRTFSRARLIDMLECAGFVSNDIYYPVPDYKLPNEIYSDAYLPEKGSLRNTSIPYDRSRYMFFEEDIVFDELCEDGRFPDFANSFLVISTM